MLLLVVSAAATGALVATPDDKHCEAGVIGHRPQAYTATVSVIV